MTDDQKYAGRLSITGIPANEPVFLFRAQDQLATVALEAYRDACISKDLKEMARAVDANIDRFVTWRVLHGSKLPD